LDILTISFTQTEIEEEINVIILDDIIFHCREIEDTFDDTLVYTLRGSAEIEGEKYTEFVVQIELEFELDEFTCFNIVNCDWINYELVF
jgi:hypothetical protein